MYRLLCILALCFVLLVYNCGLTVRNKRICYVIFRRLDPSRKFAKVAHAATDIYRRTPDRYPAPHMRAVPITDVNYMPTLHNHYTVVQVGQTVVEMAI